MGEGGDGRLLGLEGHAFMLAVLSPFLSAASSAGRQEGRQGREGRKAAYAVPAAALLRCVSVAAGSKRLLLLWSVVACLATLAHAFLRSSVDGGPARSFPIPLPPLLLSSPHSQMVHL
jgi:hypothetical protein